MPSPRKSQIDLDITPYYHCVSRCVRRAFLCGTDAYSGQSYEHRRGWVEDRLLELSRWFSIDICAFAVMSNHCHVVLHVDVEQAKTWSTQEVVEHWHGLFAGTPLSQRFLAGQRLDKAEHRAVEEQAEIWRENLSSISWFMRCLNEYIARRANEEDECTGRFWEGRFKCQALLDEAAVIACMAYVDLNPVRAGIADTPEQSDHTAVQQRIQALQEQPSDQPETLMPFVGNEHEDRRKGLAFHLQDYLELLDWTGRCIREDKPGAIANDLPPILDRLQITTESWRSLTGEFEALFSSLIGHEQTVQAACQQLNKQWCHGIHACRSHFST